MSGPAAARRVATAVLVLFLWAERETDNHDGTLADWRQRAVPGAALPVPVGAWRSPPLSAAPRGALCLRTCDQLRLRARTRSSRRPPRLPSRFPLRSFRPSFVAHVAHAAHRRPRPQTCIAAPTTVAHGCQQSCRWARTPARRPRSEPAARALRWTTAVAPSTA